MKQLLALTQLKNNNNLSIYELLFQKIKQKEAQRAKTLLESIEVATQKYPENLSSKNSIIDIGKIDEDTQTSFILNDTKKPKLIDKSVGTEHHTTLKGAELIITSPLICKSPLGSQKHIPILDNSRCMSDMDPSIKSSGPYNRHANQCCKTKTPPPNKFKNSSGDNTFNKGLFNTKTLDQR